ncbi:hypothetical protein ACVNPX_02825 [Staphylococcus aureus]
MAFGTKLATFAETIANIGVVIVTTPFVLFLCLKMDITSKNFQRILCHRNSEKIS